MKWGRFKSDGCGTFEYCAFKTVPQGGFGVAVGGSCHSQWVLGSRSLCDAQFQLIVL